MTKVKSGVKTAKDVPVPKQSGVVRKTKQWASAVERLDKGESAIEIRLPDHLNGSIQNPINAFLAALKRKYRQNYSIYARNGVIYAVRKESQP